MNTEQIEIPAGTVIHINGIPVRLAQATSVFASPENIALVQGVKS